MKISAEWISAVSAIISLGAALASSLFARSKENREKFEIEIKYFEGFRKWAELTALAITEAIHLCDLDPARVTGESFFDKRHRLRITLSDLIDKGRWLFPNIQVNEHGAENEIGFRGFRHEVLNGPAEVYRALGRMDYQRAQNIEVRKAMTFAKRYFVGQVQIILDPGKQREQFEKATNRKT